jgi:hypothetical protein
MRIDAVDHPLALGVTAFIPGGRLHGARCLRLGAFARKVKPMANPEAVKDHDVISK